LERSEAGVHIAERGCQEAFVYVLPNGQAVHLKNVVGLQSLSLDKDDLAMDEFDGGDEWENDEGREK